MLRFLAMLGTVLLFAFSPPGVINTLAQSPDTLPSRPEPVTRIGVLAFRGAQTTIAYWQPLADYLTSSIPDRRFELVPLTLISATQQIENKRIDFFITNPGHYVTLAERYGLSALSTRERLARDTGDNLLEFGSVIFVRKNSPISAISDLKGRRLAAVSPDAFGGFQIAWNEMQAQGIDAFRDLEAIRYMGFPQDAIVSAVLDSEVDAGVVRSGLLELLADEGRLSLDDVRVLNANTQFDYPHRLSSRLFPEWPFASLPGIDKTLREQVLQSLLNTQDPKIAGAYRLPDIWSAPLSYSEVRTLIRSYRQRRRQSGQSGGIWQPYVVSAAIAAAVFASAWYLFAAQRRRRRAIEPESPVPEAPEQPEMEEFREKFSALTPREREILVMVCSGLQTKAIAEELNISPKTVEFHRTNLLHKTEAGTTAHLVQLATRLGYDQGVSLG